MIADAVEEEHVWPAGYLKKLDKTSPPPYAWATNGEPLLKPNGEPVAAQDQRQRMFLPVCRSCNAAMDRHIENAAQSTVVDLVLNGWVTDLSHAQWQAVGRWWMKVLLMIGHTDVRMGDGGLHKADPFAEIRFKEPMPDLSWLATDHDPPEAASLFVSRADLDADQKANFRLVIPRSVKMADGTVEYCHHVSLATAGVAFLAVWHPGITIQHPLVESGQAWEVLHSPPLGPVAISSLPEHSHKCVVVVEGDAQVHAGHVVDTSEYSNLVATFGGGPDSPAQLPESNAT